MKQNLSTHTVLANMFQKVPNHNTKKRQSSMLQIQNKVMRKTFIFKHCHLNVKKFQQRHLLHYVKIVTFIFFCAFQVLLPNCWRSQRKYKSSHSFLRSFSFTQYPAYSQVDRGNLVLRYSVSLALFNFRDIAYWAAKTNTVRYT